MFQEQQTLAKRIWEEVALPKLPLSPLRVVEPIYLVTLKLNPKMTVSILFFGTEKIQALLSTGRSFLFIMYLCKIDENGVILAE